MKKRNFTLVELLTVIAVIAVLAGMIVPAVNGAIKKGEMTKAKAEATTLANAIKQYESTYGVLPIPKNMKSDDEAILDDSDKGKAAYTWLINLLQGKSFSDDTHGNSGNYNRRGIKFLDVVGNTEGVYQDPWDQNYFVVMDADYDGKMTNSSAKVPVDATTLHYSVVVWSIGPDGESATSADKKNKDNVYSINTTWDAPNKKVKISK